MMRKVLLFILLFWCSFGYGQMSLHNTHWLIGRSSIPVDFSTLPPQHGGIPLSSTQEYKLENNFLGNNLVVSNEVGELEFFVIYKTITTTYEYSLSTLKIFDRNGNVFPNSNISTRYSLGMEAYPIAVPFPNQPGKYILFYSSDNGLFYSIIDMTLNNGLGDIDLNQKDILLANRGSINGMKLTIVPSCKDELWLVVRSITENAYYSYLINSNGVDHQQIVSHVGHFDIATYREFIHSSCGLITASHNGKYIVAATAGGTEIYDFEKCSGRLKNARVLDTVFSSGVVFSPDDSKLYISTHKNIFNHEGLMHPQHLVGEIYQFDFDQSSFEAIQNSKTLIMRNKIYERITTMGIIQYSGSFGQLKIGIDGKIYVAKNNIATDSSTYSYVLYPGSEFDPIPTPADNNCHPGQYLHVIHNPNELGIACEPEFDYVHLNNFFGFTPGVWLQQDIKPANFQPIDTFNGVTENVIVCFENQTILYAPKNAECQIWDDGSSVAERTITESGIYWISYRDACNYQTDSFDVLFVPLPQINNQFYGCPGSIHIDILASDSFEYTFTLRNSDQELITVIKGSGELQLTELNEGTHFLQIQVMDACDTIIQIELHAYPEPELVLFPKEEIIFYGDSIQLSATGAQFYHWSPSGPLDSATLSNPWAKPLEPTWFSVLGINQFGCVDTSGLFIDIDYTMPDFIPNAFSPNNDGLNDVFKIEGLRHQKVVQFKIFNRLGQEIFSTSNIDIGWDGTFQGRTCDVGVYYYIVEIANPIGRNEVIKGEVTLVR